MARVYDIAFERPVRGRRVVLAAAAAAVALACALPGIAGTQAYYGANDRDTHVFVLPDVRISLTEQWDAQDGLGLAPGTTVVKRPVVANDASPCYVRVVVRLADASGEALSPDACPERYRAIMGTLWSDPADRMEAGRPYSASELASLEGVGRLYDAESFREPYYDASVGGLVFEHEGVLGAGESCELFAKVCVPSDYTVHDMALMGDYVLGIQAQAIQAAGFKDQQSAMEALSKEGLL